MFVHHVFFWFHEPENKDHQKKFEAALDDLVKIENIDSYHLGKPAHTPREVVDNSYQYSLLVLFKNKEQHDLYQVHKDHQVFINKCSDMWNRVKVFDSISY